MEKTENTNEVTYDIGILYKTKNNSVLKKIICLITDGYYCVLHITPDVFGNMSCDEDGYVTKEYLDEVLDDIDGTSVRFVDEDVFSFDETNYANLGSDNRKMFRLGNGLFIDVIGKCNVFKNKINVFDDERIREILNDPRYVVDFEEYKALQKRRLEESLEKETLFLDDDEEPEYMEMAS